MIKSAYILNIVFFVSWFILCLYRGVICRLFNLYDFLSPQVYINYDNISLFLWLAPLVSPLLSIFFSVVLLAYNVKPRNITMCVLLISSFVMVFRACTSDIYLPYWL